MTSKVPLDFPALNWNRVGMNPQKWKEILGYTEVEHINWFLVTAVPKRFSKDEAVSCFRALIQSEIDEHEEKTRKTREPVPLQRRKSSLKVSPVASPTRTTPRRVGWFTAKFISKTFQCLIGALVMLMSLAICAYGWWCNMPKFDMPKPEQSKPVSASSFPDCCEGFKPSNKLPLPKLKAKTNKLLGHLMQIPGIAGQVLKLDQTVRGLLVVTKVLKVSNGKLAKDQTNLMTQVGRLQRAVVIASRHVGNSSLIGMSNSTSLMSDTGEVFAELTGRMDTMESQVALLDARISETPTCASNKELALVKEAHRKELALVKEDTATAKKLQDERIAKLSDQIITMQNTMLDQTAKRDEKIASEIKRYVYTVMNLLTYPVGFMFDTMLLYMHKLAVLDTEVASLLGDCIHDSATFQRFLLTYRMKQGIDITQLPLKLFQRQVLASVSPPPAWLMPNTLNPVHLVTSYPQFVVHFVYWSPLSEILPEKWMTSLAVAVISFAVGRYRRAN